MSASTVELDIPAGRSRTLTDQELAQGAAGLSGALGDVGGAWRLKVASEQPIRVMSLMEGPSGHLANLSTAPLNRFGDALVVPLFLSASDARPSQGLLRIVNRSVDAGTVRIEAFDDGATAYGPVVLAIEPGAAVELTSADLERGNAAKGLAGSTGPAMSGHWRLLLKSALDIKALAYVRHADGLVTAMHDVLPNRGGIYLFPAFGASANAYNEHVRLMRLVNLGASSSQVTLMDVAAGSESRPSGMVVDVPAGHSLTLPGLLPSRHTVDRP